MGSDYSRLYSTLSLVDPEAIVDVSRDPRLITHKLTRFILLEQPGRSHHPKRSASVYQINGLPLLWAQREASGTLRFMFADSAEHAFTVRRVPGVINVVIQLYDKDGQHVASGRRINWGAGAVKFGFFLPGKCEPWLVIKGDVAAQEMFVFLGNPKLGGQLVAKIYRRAKVPGFKVNHAPSHMYDCHLAPHVDLSLVVAASVLSNAVIAW